MGLGKKTVNWGLTPYLAVATVVFWTRTIVGMQDSPERK